MKIAKVILIAKMTVDLAMIIVLHCLSGYHLFGNRAHEILGILFFVLFLIHNGLNARQYRFLLRGRGAYPIVRTAVIALLWVCIAADAGSALVIARDTVPQGWSLPGAAAFILRRLYSDLFLLSEFKFKNFGESPFRFFADSICMMILFAVLGWGLKKGTERLPVFKTKQS